jgi:uncharacterized damage-inducible protein DinB
MLRLCRKGLEIDMLKEAARELIEYNYAAHRRLWTCIERLTDEQFTQEFDYSMGSIRNHMVHVMSADQRWMTRVTGEALSDRLNSSDFPTYEAVRERWQTIEQHILSSVNGLDEGDFTRTISYEITRANGMKVQATNTVWQILVHIVNHGTDHRAQVLSLLHRIGAPTFEQDFMIYLWDQHGADHSN